MNVDAPQLTVLSSEFQNARSFQDGGALFAQNTRAPATGCYATFRDCKFTNSTSVVVRASLG